MKIKEILNKDNGIIEASMSSGVLLKTLPDFSVTCGFEVEVAMSYDDIISTFDFEEYFENRGDSLEMPEDEVLELYYDKQSLLNDDPEKYISDYLNEIPTGYRIGTKKERLTAIEEEGFTPSEDYIVLVDLDDGEKQIVDIMAINDIEEWFPSIYSMIEEAFDEDMEERIEEAKRQYRLDKIDEVDRDEIMGEIMLDTMAFPLRNYGVELELDYHGTEKSGKEYVIEPDSSISPDGMELVSPVFDSLDEMFEEMTLVFDYIEENDLMFTNESTGLHINIGGFDADKLDYLKLVLFLGEGKISKDFDRELNSMAEQIIPRLTRFFEKEGIQPSQLAVPATLENISNEVKKFIVTNLQKYFSINFEKLSDGYIEFRSIGGSGYEGKIDSIKMSVLRMIRALNIALDPTAYRKEYIKKIHKLTFGAMSVPKKVGAPKTPEILDAKKMVEKLYKFTAVEFISNHEDFIVAIINAHENYNSGNDQILQMFTQNYAEIRNLYGRLKSRNLESSTGWADGRGGIDYARKLLNDKKEFLPEKTFSFLTQLIRK